MDYQITGMTMAIVNMEEMVNFYSHVFGIEFESKEMLGARLYSGVWGGFKLLFCPAELAGNTAKQNRHQFDIVVSDLEEVMALAEKHGGVLMGKVTEDTRSWSIGIYDPDRNSILFKEQKLAL